MGKGSGKERLTGREGKGKKERENKEGRGGSERERRDGIPRMKILASGYCPAHTHAHTIYSRKARKAAAHQNWHVLILLILIMLIKSYKHDDAAKINTSSALARLDEITNTNLFYCIYSWITYSGR